MDEIVNTSSDESNDESQDCYSTGECQAPTERHHTCPFKEDILGDSETLCRCCENCERECRMSI